METRMDEFAEWLVRQNLQGRDFLIVQSRVIQ